MAARLPPGAVGRRVLCGGQFATVRYVGSVPPTAGEHRGGRLVVLAVSGCLRDPGGVLLNLKKNCEVNCGEI